MRVGQLYITVAAISCFAASSPGWAQQASEVVVEAPHVEATTVKGAPALSIVYKVSYADLNIGTNSGAVELQKRIKDSATQACAQLKKLYPLCGNRSALRQGCDQGCNGASEQGDCRSGEDRKIEQ